MRNPFQRFVQFLVMIFLVGCAPSIQAPPKSSTSAPPSLTATVSATSVPTRPPTATQSSSPSTPTALPATTSPSAVKTFDGVHAYQVYLTAQMSLGPRPAGSPADRATGDYIIAQLQDSRWEVVTQEFNFRHVPIRNVIAKAGQGRGPVIVIGAHYDTRKLADQDKAHPDQPVMGANDGASGVAVLLELARTLDVSKLKNEVWLAFFDAEDNGEIPGCTAAPPPCDDNSAWPWSVGAAYMAEHITPQPLVLIVVDMIGDKDQDIYYEKNSDAAFQQQLWGIAARLGFQKQFIQEYKWSMEDDHTPFLRRGIRAVDMIDFDYPYWHTTQDTADKVSPDSLDRVGRVLQVWLQGE